MLPAATAALMPFMLWLSVAGIIYGALVALAQADIKRLIAYSSVSHLGFCMLGIFSLNKLGVQGGVLQMINHGLSTGGLFAIVGMIYERYHTRQIRDLGGLAARIPRLATMMVFFTMASIGLPGLNGFAGEFLILSGAFQRAFHDAPPEWAAQLRLIAVLSVSGVVLGAWYMLSLVQRVFFGPLKEPGGEHSHVEATTHGHEAERENDHGHTTSPGHPPIRDMSFREFAALAPLIVFIFWIGLQPEYFRERLAPTVDALMEPAAKQVDARAATTLQANKIDHESTRPGE
jgi:NADH-quinone oxidoreductase subunit M